MTGPDLYGALGVGKDASTDEINAAYRRASKKTHPDAGGSSESFSLVCLAKDVLTDDERRAHYDKTGETGRSGPDLAVTKAMEMAFWAVASVIDQCEQKNLNVETVDLVADAFRMIDARQAEFEEQRRKFKRGVEFLTKAEKRMKAKKTKENRLGPMLRAQAMGLERQIVALGETIKSCNDARAILKEHAYDVLIQEMLPGYVYVSSGGATGWP